MTAVTLLIIWYDGSKWKRMPSTGLVSHASQLRASGWLSRLELMGSDKCMRTRGHLSSCREWMVRSSRQQWLEPLIAQIPPSSGAGSRAVWLAAPQQFWSIFHSGSICTNFIAWIIKDFTTAGYSGFVSALIKSCLCCSLNGGQSFTDARKLSISLWSLSSFTELVSWQERRQEP